MSDRPWLEENDPALRSERELLRRLNAEQPPAGSVDRGWTALAAEIAVLGAAVTAAAGAAAAGPAFGVAQVGGVVGAGLAAKVAVGVALAGGTLWGGATLLRPHDTQPAPPQNVPAEMTPAKPSAAVVPPAEEPTVGNPRPAVPTRPVRSTTTLAEEGRLLAKAHQLVQTGQGQEALEILRTSAARYPRSVLYQEREVLTIEALGATGAFGAAKARAERFLKGHPKSPHAGRLQRFVE
ncbi:MAG TPA: hypothetical protein VJN18_25415 [Polyangiaceae bacterium]|nr:hypothetical protein [Polyangiaceae bacterium]